jgi:hypothetical protein
VPAFMDVLMFWILVLLMLLLPVAQALLPCFHTAPLCRLSSIASSL